MIRYGNTEDQAALKKIWSFCFDDEDAYIDAFFLAMYAGRHILVAEENGVLMGASFFLPGKLYLSSEPDEPETSCGSENGRWQNIRYIYALAVYPQFRGKGIAAEILREAYRMYQAPLIAEPANEGLIGGFYARLGFQSAFFLQKIQVPIRQNSLQAAEIRPQTYEQTSHAFVPLQDDTADVSRYCSIREAHFKKHGFVSWPRNHIAFAIQEHRANGGGAFLAAGRGCEDILLYYQDGSRAVVTETTLPPQDAARVLAPYLPQTCASLEVCVEAGNSAWTAGVKDPVYKLTGMIYGMSPGYGYLNLSLD